MTELPGFTTVTRLRPSFEPQALQVPAGKAELVKAAAQLIGALWDAVDGDLSPNVTIEILKHAGTTFCRISPWNNDGVTKTVANPGDWIAIDGATIAGVNPDDYAAEFSANVPIKWEATATAPVAVAEPGRTATVTCPQPSSANRPFTYTATVMDHTAGRNIVPSISITDPGGIVTVKLSNLPNEHEFSTTITVTTQYGTTAKSVASNKFTSFEQPLAETTVQPPGELAKS